MDGGCSVHQQEAVPAGRLQPGGAEANSQLLLPVPFPSSQPHPLPPCPPASCPQDFRGNKRFANPPYRCPAPSAKSKRNATMKRLLTSVLVLAVTAGVVTLASAASSCSQLGLGASAAERINAAAAAAATAANFAGLGSRINAVLHGDMGYAPDVLLPSRLAAAAAQLQPGSTIILVSGACSLRGQMFLDDGPLASALVQAAGSRAGLQLKQHVMAFNVIPSCWRCLRSFWGCACSQQPWWTDPADLQFLSLQTAVSLLAYRLEFGVAFGNAAGGRAQQRSGGCWRLQRWAPGGSQDYCRRSSLMHAPAVCLVRSATTCTCLRHMGAILPPSTYPAVLLPSTPCRSDYGRPAHRRLRRRPARPA